MPQKGNICTVMHENFLQQALALAQQRRGFCSPNPSVGAVLVKNNTVIAQANHHAAGEVHGEVAALTQAGERARGATLYVTLQPCSHWGLTPPCVDSIIKAGVSTVYYGYADPNEVSVCRSSEKLTEAGIVNELVHLPEITEFYRSYYYWLMHKKPWVTAKLALSLDGKIAGSQGEPLTITGEQARAWTHQCRLHTDAILTSANTVNRDDPRLTARVAGQVVTKPIFIVDSALTLTLPRRLQREQPQITVFHAPEVDADRQHRLQDAGLQCVPIPVEQHGQLDLAAILLTIGNRGYHDVWVEAGGRLFSGLWRAGQLNRALLYIAAKTFGSQAQSAFTLPMELSERARVISWQPLGQDGMCTIEWEN
jgi:diaminohydroxyphosphoribosylaminopyrimidine deaminase / 5-amino-6-(5-phosphoribosylamino)uracil reductase